MRKHKRKRNNAVSLINIGPAVLPDAMYVKMKFNSSGLFANSDGDFEAIDFAGNSIFQCNVSNELGQPLGRDQWNSFYEQYHVIGSRCHIDFSAGGTQLNSCRVGMVPVNITGSLTDVGQAQELPYEKSRMLTSTNDSVTLSNYMSTKKVHGFTRDLEESRDFYSDMAANPNERWLWTVYCRNQPGIGVTDMNFDLTITYYVKLFGRRILGRS